MGCSRLCYEIQQMKYLLVLVMLVASPAWAGWEHVVQSGNGDRFLINYQTIRKDGNKVKFWQLVNFQTPQALGEVKYLSIRSRQEYDCKQEQKRVLAVSAFGNWNADGQVVIKEEETGKWQEIAPETVAWEIMKKVCKAPAR